MARIAGVDLPRENELNRVDIYIRNRPATPRRFAGYRRQPDTSKDLSEVEVSKIREYIDRTSRWKATQEGSFLSVKRLMEIGCYRGIRHRKACP